MILLNNDDYKADPVSQEVRSAISCGIRHIGIATYSSGKVKAFLVNKGYSDNIAEDAVSELIRTGYIDDEKAAGKVLRTRTGKKQESRAYIFNRLMEAGIAEDTADLICDGLPSDTDTCIALFEAMGKPEDPDTCREEYLKTASRRGYSYEVASSAFNRFIG
ncbi:MAG: RecX family transcriptional regulator [Clostridiales bacterium]|nr:RecX family transcriptional regulator [Clostridiales bacterium]